MLAEATVLGAEDLELGARRVSLEQRRDTIRRLVPDWTEAYTADGSESAVEVITVPGEISNVLMHWAERCERGPVTPMPLRRTDADIVAG